MSSSNIIPSRRIGSNDVGCLGFGAMGLGSFYGTPAPASEVAALLDECLARGVTIVDTADIYSPLSHGKLGFNEGQIGEYLAARKDARAKVFLCTKFGHVLTPQGLGYRGDRAYVLQACQDSLDRLGVEQIDLYYAHRADPDTDVTETVGAMKELKDAGKIRYIGVSEYSLDQLDRSNKVAHIDAVQIEVSPWTPQVLTNGVLEWCQKNGTALVAYSPLGRGFLTGQYKSVDDFEENDSRRHQPRFSKENFPKNLELVNDIKKIADTKGATAGQIALAWLLSKSDIIIPIPGTKKQKYLKENIDAAQIRLSKAEIGEIDAIINSFNVSGDRYPEAMQKAVAF